MIRVASRKRLHEGPLREDGVKEGGGGSGESSRREGAREV